MLLNTDASNSLVRDAASKVWNYQCFESPRKERNAIITLLVVGLLALVISILAKSRGLGIISGASLLVGIAMLVRKIYRLREENQVAQDKKIDLAEIWHTLVDIGNGVTIPAPKCLTEALKESNPKKIDVFASMDAPTSKNGAEIKAISPLVSGQLPPICYGIFKNGQGFILIQFKQTKPDQPRISADNFLLFTGLDDKEWAAYDTTCTEDSWDICFDIRRKDDIQKLSAILSKGEGNLRGASGNPDWKITIANIAKQ